MEAWRQQLYSSELYHHGIKGQKWGLRRYQNEDGTLTPAGEKRYYKKNGKVDKKQVRKYYKQNEQEFEKRSKEYRDEFRKTDAGRELESKARVASDRLKKQGMNSTNRAVSLRDAAVVRYQDAAHTYAAEKLQKEYGAEEFSILVSQGSTPAITKGKDAVDEYVFRQSYAYSYDPDSDRW